MAKFEKVTRMADVDFEMPKRKTSCSAGYDMVVAESVIIPPAHELLEVLSNYYNSCDGAYTLDQVAKITKATGAKPTLVSTGVKCKMDDDMYLELSVRSSCPLKHWLILANSVGIIDADYYNNPDNEGHIYFQVINLLPFPIKISKGDKIGQGVILRYETVAEDVANGERTGGFGSTDV